MDNNLKGGRAVCGNRLFPRGWEMLSRGVGFSHGAGVPDITLGGGSGDSGGPYQIGTIHLLNSIPVKEPRGIELRRGNAPFLGIGSDFGILCGGLIDTFE
jgi:hypothetical protein